ncbi:phage/plasmid replication protein, II/X family [Acinetobacter bereziniae]|uniref:phage/plasmid replication protein, II/X family n=1 Tax=Acinetobacter bereziniae TaxID=106648 RepID=UPI003008F0CD
MLDKLVLHCPVKVDLLDIYDDAKYCIFGMDLLDLDLNNVASYSVYKDDEGSVKHKVLKHPYSKLPTSFTEMAFKFFHEGHYHPYVELKCSPAKILQGHNVYGTDWIEQGAWEMLGYLKHTHPKLFEMIDFGAIEVKHLDVTYSARFRNDKEVQQVIDVMRNLSTEHVRKSSKASYYKNTVYFGAESAKRFARKAYGKSCEFHSQLEELIKLANRNDKSAQRVVAVMSDPNLQKFAIGLLRFETGVKAYALREHNIPTNLWQLIRYQNEHPNFLRDLWVKANSSIFKAFEGQTMRATDHDSVKKQISVNLPKVKSQDKISFTVADNVFKFYLFLENNGHTESKLKYKDQYFRHIGDLISCGITEDYLKNIAVNPIKNLDHITAYIIVSNKFKKVTKGGHVTELQVQNLFDFYLDLETKGHDQVKATKSKAQFCKRMADLQACGFSKVFLQNLKSETKNNVIPFIKFLEIKFDQQVPDGFVEPVSSFNDQLIRIA